MGKDSSHPLGTTTIVISKELRDLSPLRFSNQGTGHIHKIKHRKITAKDT
jgi:hypothetical protein